MSIRSIAGVDSPAACNMGLCWYNYAFDTDLVCAQGHPPSAHPLYEGMSNDPQRRLAEHADKPWFPYVTGWRIHPERYATEAAALAAEEARIRANLPLANREHNWANPCRLDFGAYREVARYPRRAVAGPRPGRVRRAWLWWRRLPRRTRRLVWRAGVWLALTAALWLVSSSLVGALAVATVMVGAAGRRRRRRVRRR